MFPRLQKRGPIEAMPFCPLATVVRRFHAYKSVAPLKPRQTQDHVTRARVSTLTKAWPH